MIEEDTPLTQRMSVEEIFSKLDHMDRLTASLLQALCQIPGWARRTRRRTMLPYHQKRMARAISLWESGRIEIKREGNRCRLVLKEQEMMTVGTIKIGERGVELSFSRRSV